MYEYSIHWWIARPSPLQGTNSFVFAHIFTERRPRRRSAPPPPQRVGAHQQEIPDLLLLMYCKSTDTYCDQVIISSAMNYIISNGTLTFLSVYGYVSKWSLVCG